jgi:hypothetical protein
VKAEIKSQIEQLLKRHEDAVEERDEALARAQEARRQFETAFQNTVTAVIVPAAEQIKAQIEPPWTCNIRPSGLSVTIEIFQGDMRSLGGSARPHVQFKANDHGNDVYAYTASQSQGGADNQGIKIKDLTEELVQQCLLKLMARLVNEGPPRRGALDFVIR